MRIGLELEIDDAEFYGLAKDLNECPSKIPVDKMGHAFALALTHDGAFGIVRCTRFAVMPSGVVPYTRKSTARRKPPRRRGQVARKATR